MTEEQTTEPTNIEIMWKHWFDKHQPLWAIGHALGRSLKPDELRVIKGQLEAAFFAGGTAAMEEIQKILRSERRRRFGQD